MTSSPIGRDRRLPWLPTRRRVAGLRLPGLWLAVAASILTPATPCLAGRTLFEPVVAFGLVYVDSEGDLTNQNFTDLVARLDLELPVRHRFDRGTVEVSWSPSLVRFREADAFNSFDQRYALGVDYRTAKRSFVSLEAGFSILELQGTGSGFSEDGSAFSRRFRREQRRVDLLYRYQLRRRWTLGVAAGWSDLRFAETAGAAPRNRLAQLEDRTDARASVELTYALSSLVSIGVAYESLEFDLATSGVERLRLLSLVGRRRLGPNLSLWYSVGGFRSLEDRERGDREGLQGQISVRRDLQRTVLGVAASRLPTAGGFLRGTSIDTTVSVSLEGQLVRSSRWNLAARHYRREPQDPDLASIESLQLGGRIETAVHPSVGVRFGADWLRQDSRTRILAGRYYALYAGLAWYPRGPGRDATLPGALRPVIPGER